MKKSTKVQIKDLKPKKDAKGGRKAPTDNPKDDTMAQASRSVKYYQS